MPEMTGGCRCGQVRYSANAEPIFVGICHCKSCQKQSGSAFAVVVAVPQPTLSVTGPIKDFTATGDSGKSTHLGFCTNCGSGVTDAADVMPGVTMIYAGTLDDPSLVKPTMEIYCDSAMPWVSLGGGMQKFPKMPMPG